MFGISIQLFFFSKIHLLHAENFVEKRKPLYFRQNA